MDEDLDRIVETNQKGTMRCMRAAARRMQSGASIVNVASVAGVKGCGGAAYVASKAAVIGVTKHTALRFQQTGIRCNAICPGNIITPMTTGTDPAVLDPGYDRRNGCSQQFKDTVLHRRGCCQRDPFLRK